MNPGIADPGLGALALIGLFALAAGFLWWFRVRPRLGAEGPIRLVATRSLGGKRLLALVEVESERFLLGMTDERITCLGRLDEVPPGAPAVLRDLPRVLGDRA